VDFERGVQINLHFSFIHLTGLRASGRFLSDLFYRVIKSVALRNVIQRGVRVKGSEEVYLCILTPETSRVWLGYLLFQR